ncbi:hypothetical protein KAI65_00680 [Candidatus Parcubacteria bacterium]|nr:hypothetical protein [Candidatus Parcubacteria bacterium]
MINEERKEKIFKNANQIFRECGFDVEAKDVIDRRFVVSSSVEGDWYPMFGTISSFKPMYLYNGPKLYYEVWLYPNFEQHALWVKNIDFIILSSREDLYSGEFNAIYIFRNNPDSETFFDFI